MMDSRCGLRCTDCGWKASHGCGGCAETNGHPFHGECPVAVCCQDREHAHCGECSVMPCALLYAYSYLDPEHGDRPPGARVETCRRWAAQSGTQAWENVLLTSAGFEDEQGRRKAGLVRAFLAMLEKPPAEAKVLFLPTAAIDAQAREMADGCREELVRLGIAHDHILSWDVDNALPIAEAMACDAVYVTGGDTLHLLRRLRETGFDDTIKQMVHANKVYVGVSAGSLIATPNIGDPQDKETAGLCLVHAYLSVHSPEAALPREDLPLPHILLGDGQALAVRWDGYAVLNA